MSGQEEKKDRLAAALYKRGADRGDADAQASLGAFYAEGRGGLAKDESEAARLFRLAADQGHKVAQAELGFLYSEGRGGLPKDDREATRLLELAAGQGHAGAEAALARLSAQREEQRAAERRQRAAAAQERQRRRDKWERRHEPSQSDEMSVEQALEILGLKAGATDEEVRAAYNGLAKRLHPDLGGSEFFSKQLNIARDALQRPRAAPKFNGSSPPPAVKKPRFSGPAKIVAWVMVALGAALVCFAVIIGL